MPIGGVVIATRPTDLEEAKKQLLSLVGVEIHGADDRGNIVAVFETATNEEMERLLKTVNGCPLVLHAGLTYLNMEDPLEDAERAELLRGSGHCGAGE